MMVTGLSSLPPELLLNTLEYLTNTDLANWAVATAGQNVGNNVAMTAERKKRLDVAAFLAERRIKKLQKDFRAPYLGQSIDTQFTIWKLNNTPTNDPLRRNRLQQELTNQRALGGPQLTTALVEIKTYGLTSDPQVLISALNRLAGLEPHGV